MGTKPLIFNAKEISVENIKKQVNPAKVLDSFSEQLHELFLIRNPRFRFNKDFAQELETFINDFRQEKTLEETGYWVFFPWNETLVHYLPEVEHLELRTARNKNLISGQEQEKYYNATVGVAGLSVGSHAALTLAMTGGAKNIKLADPDTISVSNLNRLRYGAMQVGLNKTEAAAHFIYEINPYSNIFLYPEGINQDNIEEFVKGSVSVPKLDILLEGVDNLEMKILLREYAKKAGIPVVMATDNGDGIIVDVERYDLEPDLLLFNGALGNFSIEDFRNFPPQQLPQLATKVAGPDYVVPKMLASVFEVGKSLYSWPQLGTAATFTGVATAYLTRNIINNKNIKSGKYDINLDSIFESDYTNLSIAQNRQEERKSLLKNLGL